MNPPRKTARVQHKVSGVVGGDPKDRAEAGRPRQASIWRHNGQASVALLVDCSVGLQGWPSDDPFPLRSLIVAEVGSQPSPTWEGLRSHLATRLDLSQSRRQPSLVSSIYMD